MKEAELKIRLTNDLKLKFKNKCDNEKITMSNKLNNLINNYIDEGIIIEYNKSIRIILVKTLLRNILEEMLFEEINSVKNIIEGKLKENLGFHTKLELNINTENTNCYGNIYFNLEDETNYSITFNVISNNHV